MEFFKNHLWLECMLRSHYVWVEVRTFIVPSCPIPLLIANSVSGADEQDRLIRTSIDLSDQPTGDD